MNIQQNSKKVTLRMIADQSNFQKPYYHNYPKM